MSGGSRSGRKRAEHQTGKKSLGGSGSSTHPFGGGAHCFFVGEPWNWVCECGKSGTAKYKSKKAARKWGDKHVSEATLSDRRRLVRKRSGKESVSPDSTACKHEMWPAESCEICSQRKPIGARGRKTRRR